jgi:hypothetical protein
MAQEKLILCARCWLSRLLRQWSVEPFLDELGIAKDRSEGGPQLMAHVGYKLRLVLAGDL